MYIYQAIILPSITIKKVSGVIVDGIVSFNKVVSKHKKKAS